MKVTPATRIVALLLAAVLLLGAGVGAFSIVANATTDEDINGEDAASDEEIVTPEAISSP